MSQRWIELLATVVVSILGSSGLWTLVSKRLDRKDVKTKLLLGLAHDRIMQSGTYYLERGYITNDEYENLYNYLYEPYLEMGGNGSAKRLMEQVEKLPVRGSGFRNEIIDRRQEEDRLATE